MLGHLRTNKEYILFANFDLLVKGQVKIKCAPRGPASNFKIVLWAQFYSECFAAFRMRLGVDIYQITFVFFILVTSGQVNFRPGPL